MIQTRELEWFRELLARELGLSIDEQKLPMLTELLKTRLDATGLSAAGYLEALAREPYPELRTLTPSLTISETYFFRHKEQIRAFSELVL